MHSPSCSTPAKLCLRLHPDRDADLIAWLETLDDLPFGGKGEAVKAALHRGIGMEEEPQVAGAAELLAQVRAVVEAAVASALANAQFVTRPSATVTPTSETDALLDSFAENLTL